MGRLRTWFGICAAAMLLVVGVPAAGADDPPPIGYPVQGAMLGALSADALRGTLFTATQTTTIGKVRAFLIGNGSSQSVTATIYVASFSGEPNRLVGRSEPFVVSHSGGTWVELSLSLGAYVEQDREYLLLLHSGATGGAMSIAFDEGGSNRSIFMPIGYGNVPDPLLSSPEYGNASFTFRTYSIYGVEDATLPQSTAAPVLTGPSSAGPGTHQLSVSTGSWSGSPTTFTYQWQSCLPNDVQPDPEDWCEDIPGATSSTLTVTPKPLTTLFRAVVTAGNSRGRVSRSSNVFALTSPTMNLVRPAITGSPRHGSTLTSTFGEWIGLGFQPGGGGPIERLKLRWQRCSGGSCTDIPGATAVSFRNLPTDLSTYVPTAADLGGTLRTVVVGSDEVGTNPVTAVSDPTAVVTAGGGGGGGGGSSVPDLAVSLAANRTTLAPGGDTDVVATVFNAGGAGALQARLVVDLPATMTLLGPPAFDRGTGCTGTRRIDCFLDYVPNGGTATVRFSVRVTGSGAQAIGATATADREAKPADNSATLTIRVETPSVPRTPSAPSGVTRTGTSGPDALTGTAFADVLRGLGGNDRLNGRGGADRLFGGTGKDTLTGGPGADVLDAGSGNDRLLARDRTRDRIRCGPGHDTVTADRADSVARDCETVKRA